MKPTRLVIKNIGMIADETIPIDKPLVLFYGEIKQGKSTILNAVRWVCGGEFPSDIIRHGQKEAKIELHFVEGSISRSWYRSKDGKETKARPVVFIRSGLPVDSPVAEIKKLLNPFLLDQDHLRNKTELDRKRFFTELFGVDTTDLDRELVKNQREAQDLRSRIGGYGDIELVPAEAVDTVALTQERDAIQEAHSKRCLEVNTANEAVRQHNFSQRTKEGDQTRVAGEITDLEHKLAKTRQEHADITAWLDKNPPKDMQPTPTPTSTAELDGKILAASAQNVRAEQYVKDKKRDDARKAEQAELSKLEQAGRDIKAKKIAKLKDISESCKIGGLAFDEEGNFTYEGCEAGMLSTSQIMKLSSELSSLYPEGFGLQILDRAESLGKSIFEFVDRAKAEKTSILATIVGEKPADVPEEVGVWVVENGKVKP